MERVRKLVYDVGVNTVANLIAAALIYLLGAWFGLLPRQPAPIIASIVLLVSGVAVLVMLGITIKMVRREAAGLVVSSQRAFGVSALVVGLCCMVAAVLLLSGVEQFAAVTTSSIGSLAAALVAISLPERMARRYVRRTFEARKRIEGQLAKNRSDTSKGPPAPFT